MRQEVEQEFQYKGKGYRSRYMDALDKLYKDVGNEIDTHRGSGSSKALHVDGKAGDKVLRNP